MMFKVDVNKVGCGQKVQMRDVSILSNAIDMELSSDSGCSIMGNALVCSTIDRIGRMLNDISQFCEVAILHAMSDLVVSKVDPQFASVCIEYGPEFDNVEKMVVLSKALSDGFKKFGIHLQNLHSVKSEYTHLTISVFGTREPSSFEIFDCGSIFLSRRLGAAKMAVLSEIDDDPSVPFVSEIIDKRFLGGMNTGFVATDVTGFGLAGAAINLSNRVGADVQIALCSQDVVHEDVLGIPVRCFQVEGIPEEAVTATCNRAKAVSFCTEFSGPTLFFVGADNIEDFTVEFSDLHGWSPLHIGMFKQNKSSAGVTISWSD